MMYSINAVLPLELAGLLDAKQQKPSCNCADTKLFKMLAICIQPQP